HGREVDGLELLDVAEQPLEVSRGLVRLHVRQLDVGQSRQAEYLLPVEPHAPPLSLKESLSIVARGATGRASAFGDQARVAGGRRASENDGQILREVP